MNHEAFTQVAPLPPTSRTPPSTYLWSDTNLTPGMFYEYHIEAVNTSGNNDFAGVNATTLTLPPSSVTASGGNAVINLSWAAPNGAVSYNVYRGATAGGEAATPIKTGIPTTSYADANLTNGTTYYYVVTAVNANPPAIPNESPKSSEVSATPVASTTATFVKTDTTTQGTWKGVYWRQGYNVSGDAASDPAHAPATPSGNLT